MIIPNTSGFWQHIETGDEIEVYDLEPVGVLCIWGPDVGITYTDPSSPGSLHQLIWTTDEWLGHIPVAHFVQLNYPNDSIGWKKLENY
jgi:hypothetical protein